MSKELSQSRIGLSDVAELAASLRGSLASPSEVEGRPNRVALKLERNGSGVPTSATQVDVNAISTALQRGESVLVEKIGTFSVRQSSAGSLSGQVAVVTGGAGGLGYAVGQELRRQGAFVALLDIARDAVEKAAKELGAEGFACDVTNPIAVNAAISDVVATYGGVDILISNAGAAHQGSLLELTEESFQKAFALNFWSHHYVARAVVQVMRLQATGGALVFNVSKQAVNPGPDFGAYGTPKAALMALMRQYAVEHGIDGITSNAVNADRIRTGLMTDEMVEQRSKARGLTPEQYMRGNLVKREVTGADVAEAFVHLAKARTSTGAVLTVDGGNVAAMMR